MRNWRIWFLLLWYLALNGILLTVPQRYIFSHFFFHYLKIGRWSLLMKFTDDTEVRDIINMEGDANMIQEDLNNLENQSNRNGMKLNSTNCKPVPLWTNTDFSHKLQGHQFRNKDMQVVPKLQVNHWLGMLRGDEKSRFDPWESWVKYFQETVQVSVAGGGSQCWDPLWSSMLSTESMFRREGLRRGWEQGRVMRLMKRTSPLWPKTTMALLVCSAKRKGERISSCHLFKEDKEQFMLKDDVDSGINGDYLTWKNQNGNS